MKCAQSRDAVALLSHYDLKIEPGQSRPIALRLSGNGLTQPSLTLSVAYRLRNDKGVATKLQISIPLRHRSIEEAHLFTYLHPSGIVSQAVIRPPGQSARHITGKLPVLVNLHGAGVAIDTPQLMQSLDEIAHLPTWFVFPSGVTTWCGDDWHHWGWGDSQAAIAAVPEWLKHNDWQGPGVDTSRLFVIGHSNGGQGVLHATTHWPDLIIAAASASGYLSIQSYVPFQLWHEADPLRLAVAHAAMNDFRHELLVSNAKDVPIFLQHGTADDNVPPYHSRRLGQLLQEHVIAANYSEQKGKGHWWDGAQVTQELRDFYSAHIADPQPVDKPSDFSLVVASPSNTGSKRGLRVDQSMMPGQLSKVRVTTVEGEVQLQTSNVLEISLPDSWIKNYTLLIDGHKVHLADGVVGRFVLTRKPDGTWYHQDGPEKSVFDLSNRRLGNGLLAILKTPDRIGIQLTTENARPIAISIAQSLYQYFAADVVFSDLTGGFYERTGDVITVGIGEDIDPGIMADYPIKVATSEIVIRDYDGTEHRYGSLEEIGAIFLRPYKEDLLQLVVWGSNAGGLAMARRLVPTISGAGQPDFVILARESRVNGIDGALAMGFFDSRWNLTKASFLS
jgi:predicted esterase